MAHDHRVWLTMLKTPWGYLTRTGFTKDVNSKDIIVLRSYAFGGKWSDMKTRIECFLKGATLNEDISKKIYEHESECKTIVYLCKNGSYCNDCKYRSDCQFWNGGRKQLKLERLY